MTDVNTTHVMPHHYHCCPDSEYSTGTGNASDAHSSRLELNDRYGGGDVSAALNEIRFEGTMAAAMAIINDADAPAALKDSAREIVAAGTSGSASDLSPEMMNEVRNSPAGQDAHEGGWAELDQKMIDDFSKQEKDRSDESTGTKKKRGGGNWLVELAKALAEVQNKFLTAAMNASDVMADSAGEISASSPEGKGKSADQLKEANRNNRATFINAQAEYSANIQMFNTMATQTATSLKSIGEALSVISRKQ